MNIYSGQLWSLTRYLLRIDFTVSINDILSWRFIYE
jgi:hypothetical protein